MKILTGIATCALLLLIVASTMFWYDFKVGCGDYLKLAGDAPSVERADQFLGKALAYVEQKGLTSGNSAFLFHTPSADLGIWYNQIKGAKETTAKIIERDTKNPNSVSQLEKDNALMKIREVILDNSQSGTSITLPTNITWYPSQWLILILWIVVVILNVVLEAEGR